MIFFHDKGIDAIKKAAEGATAGLICTPYYSERGLKLLDPFFDTAEEVEFWTRLNPLDWRDGVADMDALKSRIQSVVGRRKKFAIYVSNDLHAKVFSFSKKNAIIGSANLTLSGMTTNIETFCELTDDNAETFLSFLSNVRPRLKQVSVDVFSAYVDIVRDVISKPFDGIEDENDEIVAAINLAEETLGKSPAKTPAHATLIPSHLEIRNFVDYCREENSRVSNKVIEQIEGLSNLQGHVKQCFHGAVRFFSEFPKFIAEIADTPQKSLYDFTDVTRTEWRDFLRKHENETDEERGFYFQTLINCLPPSVGGTRCGGGGASPTLKRVFPVVARMLQALGKKDG
jgi:hypothetical protein